MKNKKKVNYSRKWYILIESLIVVIVIGIISAVMIFSGNESMNSTKASNIANNLRTLKTVAFEHYMNNNDGTNINNNILKLDKYI
ncbi:MAG: hypothetical protein IJS99_08560, partial [Synergistaceae bacterium]|nr:hypothetical protein [Synergistaceae bacterium]